MSKFIYFCLLGLSIASGVVAFGKTINSDKSAANYNIEKSAESQTNDSKNESYGYGKKKVLFIVHTETINGKGVEVLYKQMKKKGIDVKIAFVPMYNKDRILYDMDSSFSKKFKSSDCLFPCGVSAPYHACDDFGKDFDYIFVQNPYNTMKGSILGDDFSLESLKKRTKKLAYIVYGPHIFHQTTCNDMTLKGRLDLVFADSESTKKIFVEQMGFEQSNVLVSGYIGYKNVRDKLKLVTKEKKETILWMPRWTLDFRNRDKHESGSTFLSYYLFFLNYAKNNPDIHLIVRPHVALFRHAVDSKFLTKEEADKIIADFQALKNVTFSKHISDPLELDIVKADIVIADGTSALGEAVVARKPIIYLSNGINKEFESNDLGGELKKHVYFAHDPMEIVDAIKIIRDKKYIPFKQAKNSDNLPKVFNKIKSWVNVTSNDEYEDFRKRVDPVEDPAEYIANSISSDN